MSTAEQPEPDREPSAAESFVHALAEASRRFAGERGLSEVAVRMAFHDGERVLVQRARPGPLAEWISLDVYPEDGDEDEMIEPPGGGAALTPRVVVVHLRSVAKIDFLAEGPEQHRLGFWTAA